MIVLIGALRGFVGLDRLDRVLLAAVLLLTTMLGAVLLLRDLTSVRTGALCLPPGPPLGSLPALLVLGGVVITVQGFETVRYLGNQFDARTRVRASRLAQIVSSSMYIGFVAVATPVTGSAPPRDTTPRCYASPPGSRRGSRSRWSCRRR